MGGYMKRRKNLTVKRIVTDKKIKMIFVVFVSIYHHNNNTYNDLTLYLTLCQTIYIYIYHVLYIIINNNTIIITNYQQQQYLPIIS